MFNSKKLLSALFVLAATVFGAQANANDDIFGRGGRYSDRYNDQWGERWQCVTSSRGYEFRAEGFSQHQAQHDAVNMCMNHPWGSYSECQYNVQCILVNGNGGYPYPGPHEPYPQPKRYTCQTFDGHSWVEGQGRSLRQAQDRAMRNCLRHGGHHRVCQRHMQCSY